MWAPARGVRADDFLCLGVTLTESRQKTEREGWHPLGHRPVEPGKLCILYHSLKTRAIPPLPRVSHGTCYCRGGVLVGAVWPHRIDTIHNEDTTCVTCAGCQVANTWGANIQ